MLKTMTSTLVVLMLAGQAAAHEVWLERDGAGPVRVFLGEPDYPAPPGADPEFPRLKGPLVFSSDPASPASLVRKADHLEATVAGAGDVRLVDRDIFEPERGADGSYSGRVFYARVGRAETKALVDLEIVPVKPNGNDFRLVFKGRPAAKEGVTVINPDGWLKHTRADADGLVTIPTPWKGRYLVMIDKVEDGPAELGGKTVSKVTHIATLSFVAP